MIRIKLIIGLALAVGLMASSAVPASAQFKSLNGTSQGQVKIISNTTLTVGGATATCASAVGEWHLQTKGLLKEHEINGKQVKTLEGPHLYVKISKWNSCTVTVLGLKAPAEVTPCEFQLVQPNKGEVTATAAVITSCTVKAAKPAECTIKVFEFNEGTGVNTALKKVEFKNSGKNVLGTAEVEGINGEATCLAEKSFTTGKFKSGVGALVAEELNLV